jgi:murein L,D-transpeptidase YcbB/YkuD
MRQKLALEEMILTGGWGPAVTAGSLAPGAEGAQVVALRNRLMNMGYLDRSVTRSYDDAMVQAVQAFQLAHGTTADGVAGAATLSAINVSAVSRLEQVLVAMERERWMNIERGDRHVWVNLTDFHATVVDFDRATFSTRSVIGALGSDRETPEFSDVMTHMVINPSWNVPRSITVNEYLPALRSNSGAHGHLQILDSRGRVVSRNQDFSRFTASSFPFSMRQPPSTRNALGQVKFMFPNQYNIYLHDTPAQSLFAREVRAFSHGCIRLDDPFDFAYHLLAVQESDPVGFFHSALNTRQERQVNLDTPVPVHLVYRTAFTNVEGQLQFRNDIYGRDARIWRALSAAGVEIGGVQG